MAQNDNTLGAPTEGLGQNVTFAFNSNAGAPQLEIGDPGRIRAGVIGPSGGTQTRATGVDATENPTLKLLMNVGNQIIKPIMERKRTEAVLAGMQAAAAGQAVTEIAEKQPWYSKIFGDSDVVEGARAYTANAKAQTLAATIEDNMPELRKMDGPTAQRYFTDVVEKAKTGDPATDLAMMQSNLRTMPAMMRRQAKEHYGWKQERATAAEDESFTSGAAQLQKQGEALASGYATPEDFKLLQTQYVRAQVPAFGRDEKNWQEAQTARYVEAARKGQWHAVNAGNTPLTEGAPSVIATLEPAQRARIEAAVQAGQAKSRIADMPQYAGQLADLELRAKHPPEGTTPQQLYDEAVKMNETYTNKTGNKLGLWSANELIALKKGAGNAIWHARQQEAVRLEHNATQAATAEAKERAEAETTANIRFEAARGNLLDLIATPGGPTNERIDYEAIKLYREGTPAAQARLLIDNAKHTIGPIAKERDENVLAATSSAKVLDGTVNSVYADWKILNDQRPDVAAAYYPKSGPKLVLMDKFIKAGVPQADAYTSAFINPIKPAQPDKKVREATVNEIQSRENGYFKANMHPDSVRLLAESTDDSASIWSQVLGSEKDGATRAYTVLKGSGKTESIGKYAWLAPSNDVKIMPWLVKKNGDGRTVPAGGQVALDTDNVHSIFNRAVDEFISGSRVNNKDGTSYRVPGIASGKTPTHIMISPMGTARDGSPSLVISAMDDEGNIFKGLMTGNDVFKLNAQHKASEAAVTGRSAPFSTQSATTAARIANRPNLVGPDPRATPTR
jgi:hypothetical protein